MSVRIRRYVPSFKRRKLDGGSGSTFLGATAGDDVRAQPDRATRDASRDGDARLARRARDPQHQADTILELQRHRRRHAVKRQDGEDGRPDDTIDPTPETPTEAIEQDPGDDGTVTVTVSVGLSLQFATITSAGSTFVSVSTAIFTISPSEDTSNSLPVPTALVASVAPFLSSARSSSAPSITLPSVTTSSSQPASTTATTTTSLPLTISTIPTVTFASTPTSRLSASSTSVPLTFSTAPFVTSASSIVPTLSSNMTADLRSLTSIRSTSRTASLFTERTTLRSSTSHSSHASSTSRFSSHSSTRITTSMPTTSTVFPADSEPTTPLDSPTTPTIETDKGTDTGTSSNNSINEKLPPILGGIFGGLAGVGLVLWALLFLLRRRRRNGRGVSILNSGAGNGHQRAISTETGAGSTGEMSQAQTSLMPSIFGTAAGLFGRSSADAPPKEQGFVKIAGRKLPSAYDNDMVPTSMAVATARASVSEGPSRNVSGGTQPTVTRSASTRESISHDDEAIMPAPTPGYFPPSTARSAMRTGSPALGPAIEEDEPEGSSRMPPPPQIHEPGESSSRLGTPPPGVRRMHSLVGTDGVGRSLASQDGSKTSRFTEDV